MQRYSKLWAATACLALVAACGQTEAPEPIQPEPIFNKYGDVVGCTGGASPSGANPDQPCLPPPPPPPGGCDDSAVAGTASVPCSPTGEEREPEDSSTSGGGRDPGDSSTSGGGRDPSDSSTSDGGRDPGGSSTPGGGSDPTGSSSTSGGRDPAGGGSSSAPRT
ncbi:hypothetical protein [Ruegeria sp. HKCCA5491]|uniref:hypothetical protein n=1 Tax=Ruegeria sp. HKCCA5491 TaxID=2682986 RepID=UPI0014897423|nr:hypothetical protein [Ruegeria sp. HKCCA5491]